MMFTACESALVLSLVDRPCLVPPLQGIVWELCILQETSQTFVSMGLDLVVIVFKNQK